MPRRPPRFSHPAVDVEIYLGERRENNVSQSRDDTSAITSEDEREREREREKVQTRAPGAYARVYAPDVIV